MRKANWLLYRTKHTKKQRKEDQRTNIQVHNDNQQEENKTESPQDNSTFLTIKKFRLIQTNKFYLTIQENTTDEIEAELRLNFFFTFFHLFAEYKEDENSI